MAKNMINSNDIEVETIGSNLKLELSEEVHNQLDALEDYVVDSMSGNEQNKSPSVKAVKDYSKEIYSDIEIMTNKIWIDNKPIYRQVFTISSISTNKSSTLGSLISLDNIINMYGASYYNGVWTPIPRTHASTMGYQNMVFVDSNNSIKITTGQNSAISKGFLVVEYTKITD